MNDKFRRAIESGQRCRQWIVDYASLIPGGSMFETKTKALTNLVNAIENRAGDLESATDEGLSATTFKISELDDLTDLLSKCRDAARAAEYDNPGTRDRYRFNLAMSQEQILAAGRSFATGGATDQALLEAYGAPANWPALITAACDDLEAALNAQNSAVGSRVAANADISTDLDDLRKLKSTIGHMVKLYAATNPGALAAWKSAAHVERPPKKKTPPTP